MIAGLSAMASMPTLQVSQDDLLAFHAAHLSPAAVHSFPRDFTASSWSSKPACSAPEATGLTAETEQPDEDEDDDDGLGYYPDGVKRTLTDEQIAIFRHSEIQALLRERRRAEEATAPAEEPSKQQVIDTDDLEDGEVDGEETVAVASCTPPPTINTNHQQGKKKAKKGFTKNKQKGWFGHNIKPDLRKRTWDKVEEGLGGLQYDEDLTGAEHVAPPAQRSKISYDDA